MELSKLDMGKQGINSLVSDLESGILDELWERQNAIAREVYNELKDVHNVSYTTVVVTLDRLYDKGLVDRKTEMCRGGQRYIYSPKHSRQDLGNMVADRFLSYLKTTFGEASTSHLRKKLK
ncbi:MAG: BlaI/MecI/CopY family transcriptional regulator [DPANN group archaeon]|nr:BlaI/MecI/CopY family transcriptional regulator [DPANN group archaeon]